MLLVISFDAALVKQHYPFAVAVVDGMVTDELILLRYLPRLVLFLVVLAELRVPELLAAMPARPQIVHGVLVALVRDQRVLGEEPAPAMLTGKKKIALGT